MNEIDRLVESLAEALCPHHFWKHEHEAIKESWRYLAKQLIAEIMETTKRLEVAGQRGLPWDVTQVPNTGV